MILLVASTALCSSFHSPKVSWDVPSRYQKVTVLNRAKKFSKKSIALTFDDGPDRKITPQVLDMLKANGVKATFFVLGPAAKKHPQILRRMVMEGHVVANHSWSHGKAKTKEMAQWELIKTNQAIIEATGVAPSLFRTPYGIQDSQYAAQAKAMGMTNVLWTRTDNDCYSEGSEAMLRAIGTPKNGDIILLHDGPGKKKILAMLPTLLAKLVEERYDLVTVPELLNQWDRHLVRMDEKSKSNSGTLVAIGPKGNHVP